MSGMERILKALDLSIMCDIDASFTAEQALDLRYAINSSAKIMAERDQLRAALDSICTIAGSSIGDTMLSYKAVGVIFTKAKKALDD